MLSEEAHVRAFSLMVIMPVATMDVFPLFRIHHRTIDCTEDMFFTDISADNALPIRES